MEEVQSAGTVPDKTNWIGTLVIPGIIGALKGTVTEIQAGNDSEPFGETVTLMELIGWFPSLEI